MKREDNIVPGANRATLKPKEVAKILGIGKNQIYAALEKGDIPSILIGGRRLVSRVVLEKILGGITA